MAPALGRRHLGPQAAQLLDVDLAGGGGDGPRPVTERYQLPPELRVCQVRHSRGADTRPHRKRSASREARPPSWEGPAAPPPPPSGGHLGKGK